MMLMRGNTFLLRCAAVLALLAVAGCTKGGQLDPTELFSADMFESKKPLQGERQAVFPSGVPGATSGVPADLVKGYQAPPEPTAAGVDAAAAAPPEKPVKPKAKPKPKVARVPPPPRAQISVGLGANSPKPTQSQADPAQQSWPTPPAAAPAQPGQPAWPAPSTGPR